MSKEAVERESTMGFRRIKGKKYSGISEYYRDKDPDKSTIAYYIDYRDIDGKSKKVKAISINIDEVLLELQNKNAEVTKVKTEIDKGEAYLEQKIINKTLTLDELAKIFHDQRTNIQAGQDEKKYHSHISPTLGKKKVSRIETNHIKELKKVLDEKIITRNKVIKNYENGTKKSITENFNLSDSTVKDIIEYLRVIFNWAISEGYSSKINPVVVSKITNQTEDTEPGRVLTDSELDKLWSLDELIINDRLYLFLKACYFTGARPTGVISIQVKHINFDTKEIKIKAMKKGKSYKATVNDELLDLLKIWIKKHNLTHDNFIFYPIQSYIRSKTQAEKEACKNKHANYAGYQRVLRNIFDPVFNEGIDSYDRMYRVTVYTMRRTSGTKIYKKYGIVHAKKFLNHTDIKTTMHYLNVEDDTEVLIDAL